MPKFITVQMETRTCAGCGSRFRTLINSPQEFCSHFCMQMKSSSGRIPMNCLAHDPEDVEINEPKERGETERAYTLRQPVYKRRGRFK